MLRLLTDLYTVVKPWLGVAYDDESGQDLAEYGLIIALVAIAAVTALGVLSGGISSVLSSIASSLNANT